MSLSRTAYIVDDDREARMSLQMAILSAGINAWPFRSAADFLDSLPHLKRGCLFIDLRMPAMDGISLLRELERRGIDWPAIVVTGDPDLASAIAALRLGVVDLLEKPYAHDELLAALERSFARMTRQELNSEGQAKLACLTPRERDALEALVRGETTKHAAKRLELSPRTVEMHRANLMRKLGVRTATGIVAFAAAAGYRPGQPG